PRGQRADEVAVGASRVGRRGRALRPDRPGGRARRARRAGPAPHGRGPAALRVVSAPAPGGDPPCRGGRLELPDEPVGRLRAHRVDGVPRGLPPDAGPQPRAGGQLLVALTYAFDDAPGPDRELL